MSHIYTTFFLIVGFLENFATTGYFLTPNGSWHGPSAVIIVFFCCCIFCLCRRLIECLFNPGGAAND